MKKAVVNIFCITGAALILLAIFTVIIGAPAIFVRTFFEILGANTIIIFGLLLTHKFESRYVFLEYLLDISYVIIVIVVFGVIFDWYSSIPVWYLVIMAVAIYIFSIITSIVRTRKDAQELNALLLKLKEKT